MLDELKVDELVHRCDVVVHLAAAVGVKLIVEEPLRSFTTNIRGSEIVIGAAHRYRRKILVASTSEIYGKNGAEPLVEDADRILGATSVARWAYSTAKAVDEILALTYHRERDLPSIVVRLFNTVGPRQSPAYGMVIPRLVRQAVAGEPLTVYGDGAADPVLLPRARRRRRAGRRCSTTRARSARCSTSARPHEITILDLAHRIVERTGSASKIELDPVRGGVRRRLRGHAPARARHHQDPGAHRVDAATRRSTTILDDAIADARGEAERRAVIDLTSDVDSHNLAGRLR